MSPVHLIAGILPWRGPFMLDVIVVLMVFVLSALAWSLRSVRYRKLYRRHKVVQLGLATALLVVLICFEVDIQFVENWRELAEPSPYYDVSGKTGLVIYSLRVHLFFAITTLALWTFTIVRALALFPNPPQPNRHGRSHARWGLVAAVDMALTAVSGWVFYVLAFVA